MAGDLPAGASFDPARRILEVGRGPGNTLVCVGLTIGVLAAEALAASNVTDPDLSAGLRLALGAGMLLGGLATVLFIRTLWRMRWSIHARGITIRAGGERTIPWEEVESLEVLLRSGGGEIGAEGRGPSAYVVVNKLGAKSDATPTRPNVRSLRRILEVAAREGLIPADVLVKTR
ncbi:MAG: hypothetical protein ACRDK3_17360 [Actinomycetota bacterium]